MLTMLIVEDERWEREGLYGFTDWTRFGITRVETAVDGIDGLEKAMLLRPDIVITDIKMPGMDGIRMSQRIREVLPHTRIIILTGYDDFRYAQEAIRFQASGYMLKILDEEEITELMVKVTGECMDYRKRTEDEAGMLSQLQEAEQRRREQMLLGWLNRTMISQETRLVLEEAGLRLTGDTVVHTAVIQLQRSALESPNAVYEAMNALAVNLPEAGTGTPDMLLWAEDAQALYLVASGSREALRARMEAWARASGLPVCISVGGEARDLDTLPTSFSDARSCAAYTAFWEMQGVFFASEMDAQLDAFASKSGEFLMQGSFFAKQLMHAVRGSDEMRALSLCDGLFEHVRAYEGGSPEVIRGYVMSVENELTLLDYQLNRHALQGSDDARSRRGEPGMTDVSCLEAQLREDAARACTVQQETRQDKDDQMVRKVRRMAEERYMEDINLKVVAAEVYLSPNYLGNLFRKNTGKSFNEYLGNLRMEKARELLGNPRNKVSQVATKVGIPNTSYFCTLFKQAFGVAPGEYQEQQQK